MKKLCPDGGIGRRARLKIWYWQQCAGSIPVLGTIERFQQFKINLKLVGFKENIIFKMITINYANLRFS